MSRWLIRIGALLLALGIGLLSPLADMLPVDMPDNGYARIVAAPPTGFDLNAAILVAGIVLLLAGLVARHRGK